MGIFLLRRFLGLIPTLFIIATVSFFVIRLAPGGPFDSEKAVPQQILRNLESKYHLDEPLIQQYGRYLLDLLRGDLGPSFRYLGRSVNDYLLRSLPHSMILAGISLMVSLSCGLFLGICGGYFRNSWIDYLSMFIAVVGISIPLYVIGPTLMYFLSVRWGLLPTSGWITGRHGWITIIMPVVSLSAYYIAYIGRLSRTSTIEILQSDAIRTARAKGLSTPYIIVIHALKGILIPVTSYLGPAFAAMVTGSVVIETIFRIPGIGKFFIQSAFNRDYTMIMGTVLIYSTILVFLNFIVDILYGYLDPRVSYKSV